MRHKAFSFLSLILLGDVVNCQVYVTIATDNEVLYQQEKLPFICSPTDAAVTATITDIILWKNSTSGWKQIVQVWLKIEGGGTVVNVITWTDTDIRNRAHIINQKVIPSNQAGLQIEISPINVKCSDSGEYKCSINGNSDIDIFRSESAPKTVTMRVVPTSINPIQVQPQQPDKAYNPYTSVRLTCNGDVGNPASNLRWCIRTTGSNMIGDFTLYGNTNDITHGTPTLSGCQYRQQSVLTYNVSATIEHADFRCETGGISTTCGHSSAIAANYTIYMYRFIQEKSEVTMLKGVIGGLAGVNGILIIVIVILLLYIIKSERRHNTKSNSSANTRETLNMTVTPHTHNEEADVQGSGPINMSTIDYESLGKKDKPNVYEGLKNKQGSVPIDISTIDYESLGEKDKPNVYEDLKNKQDPNEEEITHI